MGPKATMRTQATTEMALSRMAWEEPIKLDCLELIRYQLPVCRNGFFRSLPSSESLMFVSGKLLNQKTRNGFVQIEIIGRGIVYM